MQNNFFEESREPSQVKARIVEKYFEAWANVIIGKGNKINRIGYVDFFPVQVNMKTKRNLHHFLSLKKQLT